MAWIVSSTSSSIITGVANTILHDSLSKGGMTGGKAEEIINADLSSDHTWPDLGELSRMSQRP